MAPAGQKFQAGTNRIARQRLGKNAPADCHHSVGSEHENRISGPGLCNAFCLGDRQTERMISRRFLLEQRFVDLRGNDRVGDYACLCEKGFAARTLACKNERQSWLI